MANKIQRDGQKKSPTINIFKFFVILILNPIILAVGMVGGGLILLTLAPGKHYWIDFFAVLIGFVASFKTGLALYEITRYPDITLKENPKISYQTQWAFIRSILISSAIIIPAKLCSNIFLTALQG